MADQNVLNDAELESIDKAFRACCYLAAGMIYLRDNPLMRRPLEHTDIKQRLLGHWGASPALAFTYLHMSRLIKRDDFDAIFLAGPGHGAPGVLGPAYLEETYSEVYPDKSQDTEGLQRFFKQFSFPGHIGSHATPELPGSIHEGGELGYSLSHAYGAVFDNPDLLAVCVVGDGEAETGPLATAWHSNKFLNPVRDGAVLPVLNLNGYKIANPTIMARMPREELDWLFKGYGYEPYTVEGDDPKAMHEKMAAAMDTCLASIRAFQAEARKTGQAARPRWPMIILRTPKGWTGPKEVDGHKVEGTWRAHQVPLKDAHKDKANLEQLVGWLKSYAPEELFDDTGRAVPEIRAAFPDGRRRMSANPHANGGLLRRDLKLPDFRDLAIEVASPGTATHRNTEVLGALMLEIMKRNPENFRLFGPDETHSNRLDAVYEVTGKTWLEERLPSDDDGGHLAPDGRVMEMLSEHTLEGWLEGYLLTGRHGLIHSYEAFAHVIDSMFNQHAKWLDVCKNHVPWRQPVASLNILLSSVVWRQDHNGFTHQDPGFIDLVTNKSADVVRIYLPPDANCLLSVANHCFASTDFANVIVADKQEHLQYLSMEEAIVHCTKGIGIWEWASSDDQGKDPDEPDLIMASCGDVPTQEALAATAILRDDFPGLKVRFVNVVDLFKLQSDRIHPHGLSNSNFDTLFTPDKPVIFNFHGYPWLVHKLLHNRTNQERFHVHGYLEEGNINTPLELAIRNRVDRFHLVMDAIDQVPKLRSAAAYVRQRMHNQVIESLNHAAEVGADRPEIVNWKWPY